VARTFLTDCDSLPTATDEALADLDEAADEEEYPMEKDEGSVL